MIGSQKVAGNNNQQAGRDINNISNYFESAKRIPSAIESVLSGLYKIQANEKATFTPPDNRPYTFMEKIEFNGIYEYQEYYDEESHLINYQTKCLYCNLKSPEHCMILKQRTKLK